MLTLPQADLHLHRALSAAPTWATWFLLEARASVLLLYCFYKAFEVKNALTRRGGGWGPVAPASACAPTSGW